MLTMAISSFVIGVAASVAASYVIRSLRTRAARRHLSTLQGRWLERIEGQPERKYSIGQFMFDEHARNYRYHGDNFLNSGDHYYHWRCIVLYPQLQSQRLLYIYKTSRSHRIHEEYDGFGRLNIDPATEGSIRLIDGYFIDSGSASTRRSFKLYRLEWVVEHVLKLEIGPNTREFHSRIIRELCEREVDLDAVI